MLQEYCGTTSSIVLLLQYNVQLYCSTRANDSDDTYVHDALVDHCICKLVVVLLRVLSTRSTPYSSTTDVLLVL